MATLILLDDDPQLREYLMENLRAFGYDVVGNANSKNILQMIDEHHADLLITDLVMPEHEGMEGIFLVKNMKNIPVIAISANAACLQMARNMVDVCLQKPVMVKQLLFEVQKLLAPAAHE